MASDTPTRIKIELMFADTPAQIVDCVEDALDWIAQEFARSPKHRQGRGEDALTNDVVTALKAIGLQATHDTEVGGHCDVVVEAKNEFLWLGEAKVHGSDYDWLWKGFQQLDTRYATGSSGQDVGGMIFYSYDERIDRMMDRWKARLLKEMPEITIEPCPKNHLAFLSSHNHRRTGLPYRVRHMPVSLYFDPKDQRA